MTTTTRTEQPTVSHAELSPMDINGPAPTEESYAHEQNGREEDTSLPIDWEVIELPLASVKPNPTQPRLKFRKMDMATLVKSVKLHGVLQPITVRSCDGHYVLVAGERRWRASAQAGRETVPAIIRDDLTEEAAAELALVENLQRHDLSIMEEAVGYSLLMTQFSLTPERIAERVGRSAVSVKNTLKLLLLPQSVQQLLASGKLTQSHGTALLRFRAFPDICMSIADYCVDEQLPASYMDRQIPNAEELEESGLIVTLRQFQTAFDIAATCSKCPFHAFRQEGNALYCLKPEEWQRKQNEAQRKARDEATRVLQEAREAGEKAVDVSSLEWNAYRDLSQTYNQPPPGCTESCPCRASTLVGGKLVPICMDTARFNQLTDEHNKQIKAGRMERYRIEFENAGTEIGKELRETDFRRVSLVLARLLLPQLSRQLLTQVVQATGLTLDVAALFDRRAKDTDKIDALAAVKWQTLLSIFAAAFALKDVHDAVSSLNHSTITLDILLDRLHPPQQEMDMPETSEAEPPDDSFGDEAEEEIEALAA